MSLSLVQLVTFSRLAAERNFTRTAEQLHVTQPAVTQHVRALEDHFSVKLVDVVGRRTHLTDAGAFLAERAAQLLENVVALEREMRDFADVRSGELRIGATVTIGSYALPALIARFARAFPGLTVTVEIDNTAAMAQAVKSGAVSLALVEGPLDDDALAIEPFADDDLVLVARPDHPLARAAAPVPVRALVGLPFVYREPGSGTRMQVEAALRAAGVTPHVVLTLPSGEGIARAVEAGIGVAIISRLIVLEAIRAGRLVAVPIPNLALARTFRSIRLRRQTPSPAALALLLMLERERGGEAMPSRR